MPRFLIVRFSSIGDIVLTSPVIRCLKLQIPDAEIHFLTKPAFVSLLEPNPYIDRIWKWEGDLSELLRTLRQQDFTYVIDLHNNLRSQRVKLALRRPSSSFRKLNIEKYLHVNFKWNTLPKVHIVDRYLDTLSQFGIVNDQKGLDFFIPADAEKSTAEALPSEFSQGYVVLVCGALKGTKRMPADMLAKMCSRITLPVVLLGGPAESELGDSIAKNVGGIIYNACGKFSLHESAACIKLARAVVTHDTGMMHIAAALKKPILSIWGNTIPEFGMYPYMPGMDGLSKIAEVKGLRCRPCSKIGFEQCPKGHFRCMRDQNPEELAVLVNELSGN